MESEALSTRKVSVNENLTVHIPQSELQLHSEDAVESPQRIPRRCDDQVVQGTTISPMHSSSLDPAPSIESLTSTTVKSLLKKGASDLAGSQDRLHLRVSRSEGSKLARKLVRSFPGIQQSPSDKPTEEQALAIDSTFLQEFSLTDSADSFTQPDRSRSSCQLYVPTSAESFTQPDHSRSSCQLYVPTSAESFTQSDRSRSSCQLYVPTSAESFTQPDRSRSSCHLYVPTSAESFTQPDHSESSGQLYMPASKTTDLNAADSIIYFSLCFDQSKLIVRLKSAKDLPNEFSKCDPFVVLHLEPNREETFQSKVIKNMRSPNFGQTFRFEGMSVESIKLQTLVLRIYNHAFNNKTIGKVCFPLDEAVEFSGAVMRMRITCPEEMEVYIIINSSSFPNFKMISFCRATTKVIYFYHSSIIQYHTLWLV